MKSAQAPAMTLVAALQRADQTGACRGFEARANGKGAYAQCLRRRALDMRGQLNSTAFQRDPEWRNDCYVGFRRALLASHVELPQCLPNLSAASSPQSISPLARAP